MLWSKEGYPHQTARGRPPHQPPPADSPQGIPPQPTPQPAQTHRYQQPQPKPGAQPQHQPQHQPDRPHRPSSSPSAHIPAPPRERRNARSTVILQKTVPLSLTSCRGRLCVPPARVAGILPATDRAPARFARQIPCSPPLGNLRAALRSSRANGVGGAGCTHAGALVAPGLDCYVVVGRLWYRRHGARVV